MTWTEDSEGMRLVKNGKTVAKMKVTRAISYDGEHDYYFIRCIENYSRQFEANVLRKLLEE